MNCTLETWSIVCCVSLFDGPFKLCPPIRAPLCSLRLSVRVIKLSKIANARSLRREILRAVDTSVLV